jgi:tetratricopeptide (TPR) repeat protein
MIFTLLLLVPLLSTPAERQIAAARLAVERDPGRPESYNALALALARRAREISDSSLYVEAERVLERSFEIAPDNFEGRKVRIWCLLGRHEFERARVEAEALRRRAPDDALVYGMLSDALVHVGRYREAEEAVQWMLDLRPGSPAALTRGAYLRELFGDVEGAVEWMVEAYQATPRAEAEDRAWILTQIGHLHRSIGRAKDAEAALEKARATFPEYHYALAELARVRAAQGRASEAVDLLRRRHEIAPHPENLFELAVALRRAGREEEAQEAFRRFEEEARAEMEGADNANRELVTYYLDHAPEGARRVDEALRLARREAGGRRDVHTLDILAWTLSAAGEHAEARDAIDEALSVGIRDAKVFYHAGVIAARAGEAGAARRHLLRSIETEPDSEVSSVAREALSRL